MAVSIGVDVGGTFTDILCFDNADGTFTAEKVPTTPADPSRGFMEGLAAVDAPFARLDSLIHGTTVGINALLQRRGAVCGLITTRGFRDLLELRRRERPGAFGLTGDFDPLIPRDRRIEIAERTDATGAVLTEPTDADVREAAKCLLDQGVRAIAVSFLHSYRNAHNERTVRDILTEVWPDGCVALSSEVLPEIGEFERTSAVAVSAYIQPVIAEYFARLRQDLQRVGFEKDYMVMQSNGGLVASRHAGRYAASTIMSGPAAGAIAASHIGRLAGFKSIVACDMGGTSFDVSLTDSGSPTFTTEAMLEFGIPLRVPMIDITSIGAGGGSIAFIDRAGLLNVGPASAGADPGPACYGRGGTEATVTDANLVLGYLGSRFLGHADGRRTLDMGAARTAIERIAKPLHLSLDGAAEAIVKVANVRMASAIRLVSVARGFDPRDFVLVPFGGAGPLHAVELMREMGIPATLVPALPGVTSALGCVIADVRKDFVHALHMQLDTLNEGEVAEIFRTHTALGVEFLREQGAGVKDIILEHRADIGYDGQTHIVSVHLPTSAPSRASIQRSFEGEYVRRYGEALDEHPIRLVNLRTAVIGQRPLPDFRSLAPRGAETLAAARRDSRRVRFGSRYVDTPVYERTLLPQNARLEGPAIVEQADTTTVIPSDGWGVSDPWGNLVIRLAT